MGPGYRLSARIQTAFRGQPGLPGLHGKRLSVDYGRHHA